METDAPLDAAAASSLPLSVPLRRRSQPIPAAFLVFAGLSMLLIHCWIMPMPSHARQVETSPVPGAVVQVILGALLLLSLSAGLVLLLAMVASRKTRERLALLRVADRPLPVVGLAELLLFVVMTRMLASVLAMFLMRWLGGEEPSLLVRVTLALGLQLPFYVITILLVVWMARARGGPLGAAGIWPFWETPGVQPPRRIGRDVLLGILGFVLFYWMLVGLGVLNKTILLRLDVPQDANPIVTSLMKEPMGAERVWVYVVVVISVVVVAPIAEEVLFRGLLYNVLCKYLDRLTAACAGALIFSFVHGVVADQWPLFALGLLLTGVYERTGRLLPAVVFHAVNNAFAVGLMMSMQV